MRRDIFTEEHESFRDKVREFVAKEITPYHEKWERDGIVARDVWLAAGSAGLLGIDIDAKYGGGGKTDYRYYLIINEELARAGAHGPGFLVHNDIVGHYLRRLCTAEQRERWWTAYCSGEMITALAITEPTAGSDLLGIQTSAVRDGDDYILNGQKTFITNGQLADLVLVVAQTESTARNRYLRFSILAVERGMPGFDRGRNLQKIGMDAQDTSELFFTDVRVPKENLLGGSGGAYVALMQSMPRERLALGSTALAAAERTFEITLAYCKQRHAFGEPIGRLQHVRFVLAEMATELAVARNFTDNAVRAHTANKLTADEAAMVKWWNTELCNSVSYRCVQLHGGYGYMRECAAGRAFVDWRAVSIFGGSTEVMKEMVGRGLGL
jgi:alkylation response protein AidB-like acyl-CoA dehydrogenase